jgi:response regulator RpfG family c-di-GMP phosphodiesterase
VQLLPSDRQELDLACRLIDLGKSWVRPAILQKQGPLDESELDSLRSHPVRAAEHLGCMPGLRRVARTIRHQNERYDGGGHPDGLRGDRIPIGSRIVAIASAFDLLTTCAEDRPLEWEEALEQLTQERGSVFDPWLLELFAEEIGKAPPATDRPVMIVPGTTMPWKSMEGGAAHDDDLDAEGDAAAPDLEVLFDENRPEERP